jgi:hypothetical protein
MWTLRPLSHFLNAVSFLNGKLFQPPSPMTYKANLNPANRLASINICTYIHNTCFLGFWTPLGYVLGQSCCLCSKRIFHFSLKRSLFKVKSFHTAHQTLWKLDRFKDSKIIFDERNDLENSSFEKSELSRLEIWKLFLKNTEKNKHRKK